MAKLTLTDLTQLSSNETSAVAEINANSALIETAMENTVSLDGTTPNSMTADFDMNGNDILNASFAGGTPLTSELTIATGAVTITATYHTIDTESDDASDDLDTISGGTDGKWLIIRPVASARSVVAKDGTGNLALAGDFTMDNEEDTLLLIYDDALSLWLELSRSSNGA